jgi:putative membrane protein
MGSDEDDKQPLGKETTQEAHTDVFLRPDPVEEMPTEEAPKPPEEVIDDSPTRPFMRSEPLTISMRSNPSAQAEHTIGVFLEDIEPSETVGIHLEDERTQTVGMHLEDEHTRTVGMHLQVEDLPQTEESLSLPAPMILGAPGGIHEAETVLTPDTPWKGLHPISLGVNLLPRAWKTIRNMWPILLFVVIGGEGVGMRFVDLVVILLFALLSVWNTFIHWATLRYRIHQGRLEIRQGLLNRQARTIDPARIQNVELVQNLFHTWTGLVELRIDTAGEQTTEGLLSALSVEEATTLRSHLGNLGSLASTGDEPEHQGDEIVSMGIAEILAFGLTQRTIGTVAVITAVGLELMSQAGPEATADLTVNMQPTMIVAAFLLAFVASWAVSALTSLFRYFDFKLTRLEDVIRTTQGLTTKRRIEIPLTKVQMVRTDEPLMRRLMGFGTVLIETAGLSFDEGSQSTKQAEGIVPMVEQTDLGRVTSLATPHADVDPWSTPLNPAHPRSLYRSIVGSTIRASVLIGLGMAFFGPIKWALPALLPIAWVGAWLDWAKQGWLVTPTAIVSRRGFFNRRTFIISRDKLQSVHMVQGPFMRLHGLNRLVVSVAGSRVSLPETGTKDSDWLISELSAART